MALTKEDQNTHSYILKMGENGALTRTRTADLMITNYIMSNSTPRNIEPYTAL